MLIAFLLAVLAAELPAASPSLPVEPVAAVAPEQIVAGQRQRPVVGPLKRGIHELKDPSNWPAEPPEPAGPVEAARFDEAVIRMCAEVAPDAGLPELARVVREVATEKGADPFLMAALVYRESRCRPRLISSSGVGLLQIKASMFAAGAKLPFPREALAHDALMDPAHNLSVGIALLKMWEAEHVALDRALGSTPHRTAVAHLYWGDRVWGSTTEDRTLTARRRLLEAYANQSVASRPTYLGLDIVSPLEGFPRLGTSGLGADREGGERSHRGVDVDATTGEPVRAVADGTVVFAGADLTGDHPALAMPPRYVRRWKNRNLGPGGIFVRILHTNGIRSGYFHLNSFRVEVGQTVRAGEVIGTVGRTGVKASGSHLHFEVHVDGELKDPAQFLAAYVLPPTETLTFERAMAEKKERLHRLRRQARAAARRHLG